ncbi:odorant receptor 131-2-like [Hoplias malabaricus]|uniref:odorant receptor 131-2-like n=1 Tax=Hoplias malabaricus TaxID=27720 RepID=UPI003462F07F
MALLNGSTLGILTIQQQLSDSVLNELQKLKLVVPILMSLFFVYVNSVMFCVLRSKRIFKETPRYILFGHMLFNDSVQLIVSSMLYTFALAFLKVVTAACAFIIFVSSATFRNTPLNLAVMSLERYVAICFPLRHTEIATQKRTYLAIVLMWCISSINPMIDLFFAAIMDPNFLTMNGFCSRDKLFIKSWQLDMFNALNVLYFVSVTVIIIFTYISIMITARSVSSSKDSARKAYRTVLLHLFQLGLSLTSFLYVNIERALYIFSGSDSSLYTNLRYLNFVFVLILPRSLSPLIYGLRDDAVRPLYKFYFFCGSSKIMPVVNVP